MQDLAEAQYYLGLCFLNGTGVVRNEGIAVDWLGKAAEQGLDEAKKMLDIIKKHNEGVRQQSMQQNQFGI